MSFYSTLYRLYIFIFPFIHHSYPTLFPFPFFHPPLYLSLSRYSFSCFIPLSQSLPIFLSFQRLLRAFFFFLSLFVKTSLRANWKGVGEGEFFFPRLKSRAIIVSQLAIQLSGYLLLSSSRWFGPVNGQCLSVILSCHLECT